jgi:phosphoribosylglycinamide formyltransferase-1
MWYTLHIAAPVSCDQAAGRVNVAEAQGVAIKLRRLLSVSKPKLLVFASGTEGGGGSGFETLGIGAREGVLDAEIVGVVSNHKDGGVRRIADKFGIPFFYFGPPWSYVGYVLFARESGAEFFALSGWIKKVEYLDPRVTFNIHPGPVPTFGGRGMYGHHVHERVMQAYRAGIITHTMVCMHFVTKQYDEGPCFFRRRVPIQPDDTPETLGKRVNDCEHRWQPYVTNLVVNRQIQWDGKDIASLRVPPGYQILTDEDRAA